MGFLSRTGAEIGYQFHKKYKKKHLLLLKRFKNTGSAQLCTTEPQPPKCPTHVVSSTSPFPTVNPLMPGGAEMKISQFNFKLTFKCLICQGNGIF